MKCLLLVTCIGLALARNFNGQYSQISDKWTNYNGRQQQQLNYNGQYSDQYNNDNGQPYQFSYKTGNDNPAQMFREEQRSGDGSITGKYGWVDPNGHLRVVNYRAGRSGFEATGDTGPDLETMRYYQQQLDGENQRQYQAQLVFNEAAARRPAQNDWTRAAFNRVASDWKSDPTWTAFRDYGANYGANENYAKQKWDKSTSWDVSPPTPSTRRDWGGQWNAARTSGQSWNSNQASPWPEVRASQGDTSNQFNFKVSHEAQRSRY